MINYCYKLTNKFAYLFLVKREPGFNRSDPVRQRECGNDKTARRIHHHTNYILPPPQHECGPAASDVE